MSEHDEQVAVVEWCDANGVPVFHVPNGGLRSKATAAKLKAEGVRPGVPDLCVPLARCGYHGLWVEMKDAGGKGRISPEQAEWIGRLREEGYCAWVCRGAGNAIDLIDRYRKENICSTTGSSGPTP